MPIGDHFAEFDETPFAAASIGQVHRATTHDGDEVAVKVQYPGVAEAVETDLRNLQLLLPLVKRLAPGLDVKALGQELRERIGDELDYEVEAQNHRAIARAFRGHPFACVPPVDTALSHPPRARHRAPRRPPLRRRQGRSTTPTRDRFAEIVFRFFFGTLQRTLRRAVGDPHPGNYLLLDDGRVGFLDFGLMRVVDADYLDGERALAQAAIAGDAAAVHGLLAELGYLPEPDDVRSRPALLDQLGPRGRVVLRARLPPPRPRATCRAARPRSGSPALALLRGRCSARRSRRRRC